MPRPIPANSVPDSHQSWLAQRLTGTVSLTWTDNRTSMLSVKRNRITGYEVRLHHMFRHAPAPVWQALLTFIRRGDQTARQTLHTYVQQHQHLIRQPQHQRPLALCPQGRYFDLEAIYHDLNRRYLANRVQARITWSRRPPKRPRSSIRFGSYHADDRLIRIHRLLDQAFVPQYVVENVVFHEMLHQLIPRRRINGRWSIHPPEFRRTEQQFPSYSQAEQWKRRHLGRLLRGGAGNMP